jgi:hypothetical protein
MPNIDGRAGKRGTTRRIHQKDTKDQRHAGFPIANIRPQQGAVEVIRTFLLFARKYARGRAVASAHGSGRQGGKATKEMAPIEP